MTVPFSLLTAFSSDIKGGGPAAVVFMESINQPLDIYRDIALNFNQPITTFLSPLSSDDNHPVFDIRWFADMGKTYGEVPLCGHGTLAAAGAIFERNHIVKQVEFRATSGQILTACKREDGSVEVSFTPGNLIEVSQKEQERIKGILTRAFGREVVVNHIAHGGRRFENYLMIELDEREELKDAAIDYMLLSETGFGLYILTKASSNTTEQFLSRVFIMDHSATVEEDPVCGSAHCVVTPYWYSKLGIPRGHEIRARQVSARGGELRLLWEFDEDVLRIGGAVTILAEGKLRLPDYTG